MHNADVKDLITQYSAPPAWGWGCQPRTGGRATGRQDSATRTMWTALTKAWLTIHWSLHCIEEHGGERAPFIFTIGTIESRPLYRVVRESVEIGAQPMGPENMNRCQEWGAPRVPILSVLGGDGGRPVHPGVHNKDPEWTKLTLESINVGGIKRVQLQDARNLDQDRGRNGDGPPKPAKRARTEASQDVTTAEAVGSASDPNNKITVGRKGGHKKNSTPPPLELRPVTIHETPGTLTSSDSGENVETALSLTQVCKNEKESDVAVIEPRLQGPPVAKKDHDLTDNNVQEDENTRMKLDNRRESFVFGSRDIRKEYRLDQDPPEDKAAGPGPGPSLLSKTETMKTSKRKDSKSSGPNTQPRPVMGPGSRGPRGVRPGTQPMSGKTTRTQRMSLSSWLRGASRPPPPPCQNNNASLIVTHAQGPQYDPPPPPMSGSNPS